MKISTLTGLCIFLTVAFTSAAQLILKWQVGKVGAPGRSLSEVAHWFFEMLLNPWIIAVLGGAFLAAMSWFFVVGRVPLSIAYPFVALTFPAVVLASAFIFGDPINWRMVAGLVLIVAGLVVGTR